MFCIRSRNWFKFIWKNVLLEKFCFARRCFAMKMCFRPTFIISILRLKFLRWTDEFHRIFRHLINKFRSENRKAKSLKIFQTIDRTRTRSFHWWILNDQILDNRRSSRYKHSSWIRQWSACRHESYRRRQQNTRRYSHVVGAVHSWSKSSDNDAFRTTSSNRHDSNLGSILPAKKKCLNFWSTFPVKNYNKSRIYSSRGAKNVEITLDGRPIFKGEISQACGNLSKTNDPSAYGEVRISSGKIQ